MVTEYTIYLVNNSADKKTFWSFLQPPNQLAGQEGVFANSSANLTVGSRAPSLNRFVIPVQYSVGAGADNKAVGLNTKILSNHSVNTDLGQAWLAQYVTAPPQEGPLVEAAAGGAPDMITISSNNFDKVENEGLKWFSNMSFGIETASGYMGMTWSPAPGDTRTISPKLNFYIATGNFDQNKLARWTDISTIAAHVQESDFSNTREVTVTLNPDGTWSVVPGAPKSPAAFDPSDALVTAHKDLAAAHRLICERVTGGGAASMVDDSGCKEDSVQGVQWDDEGSEAACSGDVVLSGTLTVGAALGAAFTYFMLSGVRFKITRILGSTSFEFSYDGDRSAEHIKGLLKKGSSIRMCG